MDVEEGSASDMVATARRADVSESAAATDAAAPEPSETKVAPGYLPPHPPYPRPRPQSGLLTAGEHDDLLNPELYADYVRRSDLAQAIQDLPQVDTTRVLTVAVRDNAGRPVPFAAVELACADGSRLRLTTMADGTVAFFPELDRLGSKVSVRAGSADWRDVTIGRGWGGQRIEFTQARQAPAVRKLDLMLAIDTTGSMSDEIRFLQAELRSIIDALRSRHQGLDLRVGFVFYRDLGDDYVTATWPLSSDVNAAQRELSQRFAAGGGDYPEAMEQALIRTANQSWRPDAVKTMLLVADAPPHDEKFGLAWRAAEHLRASRVHIVPVAASGVADKAEFAMRAMAAATQSRYTFLTDDSGIGNPHAPPAIDCYLVTRLDALLRRVIDSQLSGRRIEPGDQEVIRNVGQYENGRCIIPRDMQMS
jgi:Mg-chelatase subunit ChlD